MCSRMCSIYILLLRYLLYAISYLACHVTRKHTLSNSSVWHSAGIAALPSLKLLDLSDNVMSGPLPGDWSRATQLSFMLLENNAFSGTSVAPALHHCLSEHKAFDTC